MVYLIDTDVMIDVSRENTSAASYLDSLSDLAISIITARLCGRLSMGRPVS